MVVFFFFSLRLPSVAELLIRLTFFLPSSDQREFTLSSPPSEYPVGLQPVLSLSPFPLLSYQGSSKAALLSWFLFFFLRPDSKIPPFFFPPLCQASGITRSFPFFCARFLSSQRACVPSFSSSLCKSGKKRVASPLLSPLFLPDAQILAPPKRMFSRGPQSLLRCTDTNVLPAFFPFAA